MTVKDYYEVIRDIDRLAAAVDAEGAVTLDHDDAEQIWALGTGGGMMCKWMEDEVCVNSDCPAVADFCPVVNHPGVCRYEEMDENKGVVRNDTLSVKEG